MNNEITMVDYLNNSGTQGSEPIYKSGGMSIKRYELRRNKDGTYTRIDLDIPRYKIIKL